MAAGQGFKTFVTGEVLTAGDVNGYLMQGINVFTNATARDAAITAPAEGQFAFTKDNNSLWYYDGAAWVASGATGDIEGVTAGIGISGGGTSGTVTVTNSMATAIDAKGDLVPGTGADTFSRLAVGANDTVLTADSTTATGLKWANGSGMTLLSTTTLSGASTTITIGSGYNNVSIIIYGMTNNTANGVFSIKPNNSAALATYVRMVGANAGSVVNQQYVAGLIETYENPSRTNADNVWELNISQYASTVSYKPFTVSANHLAAGGNQVAIFGGGSLVTTSAITSIVLANSGGTFSAGTVLVYGVK
jgi:hypothetical protein